MSSLVQVNTANGCVLFSPQLEMPPILSQSFVAKSETCERRKCAIELLKLDVKWKMDRK